MHNLNTDQHNTWCIGCGNFGILAAIKKVLKNEEATGKKLINETVMTCGIGCHGKIFDYLNISGFYSLHGRAMATATGVKLSNPDLRVICFGGDGDSMGEGLEHTLFAAKRNLDVTLILHNNGTYGLTTGQFTPLSKQGYKGPSTPQGTIERPFHALTMLKEAGATFLARTYTAKLDHMEQIITAAINHKGFSVVEVMQPCVSFNNTYSLYNEIIKPVSEELSGSNMLEAMKSEDPLYVGIFYQEDTLDFCSSFLHDFHPLHDRLSQSDRKIRVQKAWSRR